jgi:hypothetical protein
MQQNTTSKTLEENVENVIKNDEVIIDEHKEYWTLSETKNDETCLENCGVVVDLVSHVVVPDDAKGTTPHEHANCCKFGCGCRVGLDLGTRLKFERNFVDSSEYCADTGRVDFNVEVPRNMAPDPVLYDLATDPGGTGNSAPKFRCLEPKIPDADSEPPDWSLVDLEECAASFVRQADGGLRRTSNCNDPRCVKFDDHVESDEGEKWIKITMDDEVVENIPMNVEGERDKGSPMFGRSEEESVNSNGVDENGNDPGLLTGPGRDVLGGRPPDNCDHMRGASKKDSLGEMVVTCLAGGAFSSEADTGNPRGNIASSGSEEEMPLVTVGNKTPVICCKVMEELQATEYAVKSPSAPSGGHAEIQESVAAQVHEPGSQPTPRIHNANDQNDVLCDMTTGSRLLKLERLFSDDNLKRTFDQDPFALDLSYDLETFMVQTPMQTPRLLEHLNLSGCFRITDVGLR